MTEHLNQQPPINPEQHELYIETENDDKIIACLDDERSELVTLLKEKGITVKLIRGATLIELPRQVGHGYYDPMRYELIEVAREAKLFIDCSEGGGGLTRRGSAVVVCGASGKALRPYYVPHGGHLACGTHAYFSVPNSAIKVSAGKSSTIITIHQQKILHEEGLVRIGKRRLWSGEAPAIEWKCSSCQSVFHDECSDIHNREGGTQCYGGSCSIMRTKLALPETFDRFQAAALAARVKANCYHCRHVHYADLTKKT